MSLNEEFDELARRKLEERAFPFAEADWQDARKQIDAARGGRNGAKWITGAAVLLLISGLVWYGTRSTGAEETIASLEQAAPPSMGVIALDQPVQNETSTPVDGTSEANGPAAATVAKAPSTNSIAVHPVDRSAEARPSVHAAAVKSYARKEEEQNTSEAILSSPVLSKKKVASNKQAAILNEESKLDMSPEKLPASRSDEYSATTSATDPADTSNPIGRPIDPKAGTTTQQYPAVSNESSSAMADLPNAQEQPTLALNQSEVNEQGTGDGPISIGPKPIEPQTNTEDDTTAAAPQLMPPTGIPAQASAEAAQTTTDSTAINTASNTLPSDSAIAAAAALAPPPLVPERAPWEVSVLGGMFSSTSKYAGSNSADWSGNISSEKSFGIGAELIHMGRNFGIGTGLHYGSYAERIRTDAIDANTTTLHNFWYLMPVDTMILVITDTLPGTPPTFTGTSENSTVNVLTQGTDTTTNSEHLRDARDQVNRVSYFEVPILLDAHLTQGRWMLGLRGGPTIGLLTGRRGAIPAPDNEGYVPFTDLPFRELTLGYTARAYVRYRFNAAWSVGIEPAMRGQLMNSLSSGDLERRSSALGVMMSLTYRLR